MKIKLEAEFLFDNQLIAQLEKLIKSTKYHLLLVSPYIDFDPRIIKALLSHIENQDFCLYILFGKAKNRYTNSLERRSLEFLRRFPNIEIRYNERLHAKYYQNDTHCLITSMNLYNYSLANNIEAGVIFQHTASGSLKRIRQSIEASIDRSLGNFIDRTFGSKFRDYIDPLHEFSQIYEDSKLLFKNQAILKKSRGLKGIIGKRELGGIDNKFDLFDDNTKPIYSKDANPKSDHDLSKETRVFGRRISIRQYAKQNEMELKNVKKILENQGLISDQEITEYGFSKGLIMKQYMGNHYIAIPEEIKL